MTSATRGVARQRGTSLRNAESIIAGSLLSIGVALLGWSINYALNSGRDADIARLWRVTQYVARDVDPYPVALHVLKTTSGSLEELRARRGGVPGLLHTPEGEVPGLVPELGPPEASYPPWTISLLTISLGWIDEGFVIPVWLVLNVCCAIGIARQLSSQFARPFWLVLGLVLCFTPTQAAIARSTVSLPVLLLILWAFQQRSHWSRGCALGLSLVKPSMAVPYLGIPLVRSEHKTVIASVGIVVALLGLLSLVLFSNPLTDLVQWLEISEYFRSARAQHSIPELLFRLGLEGTRTEQFVIGVFMLGSVVWMWLYRRASTVHLTAFAACISVLWVYHLNYDWVVLLPVVFTVAQINDTSRHEPHGPHDRLLSWGLPAVLYLALTIGSSWWVLSGDPLGFRLMRWVHRLLLLGLYVATALQLRRAATETEVLPAAARLA